MLVWYLLLLLWVLSYGEEIYTFVTSGGPTSQLASLHGSEPPVTCGGQPWSMKQSLKSALVKVKVTKTDLNLLHVTGAFVQVDMQPTPSHCPIQVVAGAVVGALPRQASPTKCLPSQGHWLASLAKLGVVGLFVMVSKTSQMFDLCY